MTIGRRRRAFTLLEMLVAIGLLAMLLGSMFAFLFDMLAARQRALETAGRQLAATTLIDALEHDMAMCMVGDEGRGAGIEGDNERLRVLVRGVAGAIAGRGSDDPAVFGDLQAAEYRFDPATGRLEGRRGPAGEPGAFAPLGGEVARVRFRYHDGTLWRDSFDSLETGALPLAVEVMIWFTPWPGDELLAAGGATGAAGMPERATFGASAGFDELAFAGESDLEDADEPAPDRFRVIAIPDARPDESPAAGGEPLDGGGP